MSLALLLEKYDVSTEEGLQKALSEIEKEEEDVDEALTGALSRACDLEGRLRNASQAFTRLGEVRQEAQNASDMVDRTAELARDVSAKVRQLDLARSRVAECQRRVHDLIDLQLCSAGVEAAIKAHDYETGAMHVCRYLSMDPQSVVAARARGAPDPRADMTRAAHTLTQHLVHKFEEAAKKEDDASIERLFKLFPQIGRAEQGVDLFAKYLASQLEVSIRRGCVVSKPVSSEAVFADAMTRVLEAGGAAVDRARAALAASQPQLLSRAIALIQPTVCAGAGRVYTGMVSARGLVGSGVGGGGGDMISSALSVEPAINELALTHSRVQLYFAFLRRKTEAVTASLPEDAKKAALDATEKIIRECELTRTAQDILGHYLYLERYFLEESVNKALKLAAPQSGATSSSLVDDVFFIARKVIRRSVSTGSVDGACAVLNDAVSQLEVGAGSTLRRWLRAPPPDVLVLPPPPRVVGGAASTVSGGLDAVGSLAQRLNRDVDAQRALFIAHMNEAEFGAEWSERLAAEACMEAAPLLKDDTSREKYHSCASGLGSAAAAFRAAYDLAMAGLKASLKPRVVAWAEMIADPDVDDDEIEDDADLLPRALDALYDNARAQLSSVAADDLLVAVVSDIAQRAQARILHHHYTREGGLAVERRARRLSSWAGGNAPSARERCSRVSQLASLLAIDTLRHVHDALPTAATLAPNDIRNVLARRTDFKMEEIKRLKL